jgi:hypothetical protein
MAIVKSEHLTKLAQLIFEKTGLVKTITAIKEDAEYEIEGAYGRIDTDDEDEPSSSPSYGGVVYHSYHAIVDGELSNELDRYLSESERNFLFRLIEDKNFEISIERQDYSGQRWSFSFNVPIILNKPDSKTFEIDLSIRIKIFNSDYQLEAVTYSEISEDEISKILTMYSLQL